MTEKTLTGVAFVFFALALTAGLLGFAESSEWDKKCEKKSVAAEYCPPVQP